MTLSSFFELPILTFFVYKKIYPNIVHTHTGRSSIGLKLIPKKVLKIIHRRIPDKLSKRALSRMKKSDSIIAISDFIKNKLIEQDVEPNKINKIYSSYDDYAQKPNIMEFSGNLCFAYIGHFRKHKGIDVLLEAVNLIKDNLNSVKILIIGEGEEEKNLKKLCFDLGVSSIVEFIPFQKNPLDWVKSIDLLLLPSRSEGLGSILLEAQRLGTPILSTNVGGISEIVEHEKTGWLVPANNVHMLADAINFLAENENVRVNLAIKALEKTKNEFSSKRMAIYTKNLYLDLMNNP